MIVGLFTGLLLMVTGTIIGCLCGIIKEIPRAVLLCFAVLFVYFLALSIDISETSTIFVTSIPFIKQIRGFNSIVQQISNVGDWTSIYQIFSEQFFSIEFLDEVIKLWIFSFEVSLIHSILFPQKHYKWWYDWFIWYLKECLAIGVLILFNSKVLKGIGRILPGFLINWLPRIFMGLLATSIILCTLKLIFKFAFPLLDVIISYFTNNSIGRLMVSTTITTGVLILIVFAFIIFKVKVPQEVLMAVKIAPIGLAFFIVWYILYALIGYRKK